MTTFGILLFEGVEELDAVGPYEVLAVWQRSFPDDGASVSLVTRDGAPVTGAKGMLLTPHRAYETPEVLLYPGGQGTRPHLADPEQLDWVRAQRAAVPLLTSVCTGSLVYAAAGLLRGRPATTHWGSLNLLAELDPTLEVRPKDRYVDDGDVITSAGVSAGIDMALHLVRRFAGDERCAQVRRAIQYDPQPPV